MPVVRCYGDSMTEDKLTKIAQAVEIEAEAAKYEANEENEKPPKIRFLKRPDEKGKKQFADAIGRLSVLGSVSVAGIGVEKDYGDTGMDRVTLDLILN